MIVYMQKILVDPRKALGAIAFEWEWRITFRDPGQASYWTKKHRVFTRRDARRLKKLYTYQGKLDVRIERRLVQKGWEVTA